MSGITRWLVVAQLAISDAPPADLADAGAHELVPEMAQDGGTRDRELIRRVVRFHVDEVRRCYQAELVRRRKADAGAAPTGKLTARWVVGAEGRVTSVELLTAVPGTSVRFSECVTDSIRTWLFPKPNQPGVAVITYPFVFRPTPDDAEQQL